MQATALGFLFGFLLSCLPGKQAIQFLRTIGARQTVSEDAPEAHLAKQGTPTMGGALILLGCLIPPVVMVGISTRYASALGLVALTGFFGLIGFVDDLLIARRGKNLGLRAREKFALQFVGAIAFVVFLYLTATPGRTTILRFGEFGADLGVWYYVLGVLFIVGLSNAVNFTDGLDGLAAGVTILIAAGLAMTLHANVGYEWLHLFVGALAGGCAGFLWFNAHPAQVFMGDTGSLAIGAALAGAAMMGKAEMEMQVFSVVPYLEVLAVAIQVTFFKLRKRKHGIEYARANRVFRRTPLHHHFEECGWKETKIVARFWLLTLFAVALVASARN